MSLDSNLGSFLVSLSQLPPPAFLVPLRSSGLKSPQGRGEGWSACRTSLPAAQPGKRVAFLPRQAPLVKSSHAGRIPRAAAFPAQWCTWPPGGHPSLPPSLIPPSDLLLICQLIGRGELLHLWLSQALEAPPELGQFHAIRIACRSINEGKALGTQELASQTTETLLPPPTTAWRSKSPPAHSV